MNLFFYFVTAIEIIELIFSFYKTRRIFTIHNMFFFGVTLNFILYLCNYSIYFTTPCQPITYLIISISQLMVTFFDLLYLNINIRKSKNPSVYLKWDIKSLKIGKRNISISSILFIVCLICSIIENIISYNTIFPFLSNIDSHKNSIAILGIIWKTFYPISLFCFYFEYIKGKKKSKLEYVLLSITVIYLLISAGVRFWSFISLISLFIFIKIINKDKIKKISFNKKIFIAIALVILAVIFINMGQTRLQSKYTYMNLIGYIGPLRNSLLGNVISWYYGYFPYSFHNLNLTLLNIENGALYTNGSFFIVPFLYLTKLHHFFNLDYTNLALSVRVITNTSATVATAFFEFYADFHYFFFLPILFYLLLIHRFEKGNTLFCLGAYSYSLVLLFLFNFYNVFSSGIPYTFFLCWWIFNKFIFYKREEQ